MVPNTPGFKMKIDVTRWMIIGHIAADASIFIGKMINADIWDFKV